MKEHILLIANFFPRSIACNYKSFKINISPGRHLSFVELATTQNSLLSGQTTLAMSIAVSFTKIAANNNDNDNDNNNNNNNNNNKYIMIIIILIMIIIKKTY